MGTSLGPKYIPYTCMDPLGYWAFLATKTCVKRCEGPRANAHKDLPNQEMFSEDWRNIDSLYVAPPIVCILRKSLVYIP